MNKKETIKRGYKASSLGPIPTDWEVRECRDVAKLVSGLHLSPNEYTLVKDGYPYFTGPTDYTNDANNNTKWTTKDDAIAYANDILITVKGSGVGGLHFLTQKKVAIGRQVMALRATNSSSWFLYYLFSTREHILKSLASGNMIPGLSRGDILTLKIPTPNPKEQTAIANLLNTWDKAINTLTQLIAQKELRKKWLMQQLLTGRKRLKGFEGSWREVRIGDVAEIDKKSLSNLTPPDYSFQYISLSDVDMGDSQIKSEKTIFRNAPSRARRIVSKGDILLATVRPNLQGFLIIREKVKDLIASTGFSVISCTKIHNEFLYQFLLTKEFMKQIETLIVGSNYPAINSSDVRHLKVPFPELDEQVAISKVLSSVDSELFLLKKKIELLKEQKKGLMQILLTGKKRLKI